MQISFVVLIFPLLLDLFIFFLGGESREGVLPPCGRKPGSTICTSVLLLSPSFMISR